MSRKAQQGTAEHPADPSEAPSGRFSRLRALPGFRTATVAFILTVVLGLGGTAAYAYWQVSTTATITVTPTIRVGQPSGLACEWYADPNRIFWNAVPEAQIDRDVVYFLTFTRDGRSKSYAVPRTQTSVRPAKLDNLQAALGQSPLDLRPLTVTLQTAVLRTPIAGKEPVESNPAEIVAASAPMELKMYYYTSIWANYPCGRY